MAESRRLAAILAADIAGYSTLMGADEARTVRDLKDHQAVVLPMIGEHGGRIIDTAGDGILAEFASVVNAVECALAVQGTMQTRNLAAEPQRRMRYRIGINLGDVIYDEARVYGDGINIAARLEGIADPGGVCISRQVYELVEWRLAMNVRPLGPQTLKNIARPIDAYAIDVGGSFDPSSSPPRVLGKPSIAVLPFANMSGDPEQEYFSDGITDDIITALSRIRQLLVVARNTTFTYKGRAVNVQAISRELSIRYVLEGSVRKVGNRVRISVQLVDGETGSHLWAEMYDRSLEDIFAVQDDITTIVVGTIDPEISRAEQERVRRERSERLSAWDCYQRGLWHLWKFSRDGVGESKSQFHRAIEIDPSFSASYAALSFAQLQEFNQGLSDDPAASLSVAFKTAKSAISIDDSDPLPHWAIAFVYLFRREFENAIDESRNAIDINPSFAAAYTIIGHAHAFNGQPAEAIPWYEKAMRLSPKGPMTWLNMMGRGFAHYFSGEWKEAQVWARRATQSPAAHVWAFALHAAVLAQLDQSAEARAILQEIRKTKPDFCEELVRRTCPFNTPMLELFVEGLRKAGLAEHQVPSSPADVP